MKTLIVEVSGPITLTLFLVLATLLAAREMLIVSGHIPSRRVMHSLTFLAIPVGVACLAMVLLRFVFLTVVH